MMITTTTVRNTIGKNEGSLSLGGGGPRFCVGEGSAVGCCVGDGEREIVGVNVSAGVGGGVGW